ncbi:MAG TPA: bifunctional serine/threonine-protein kinase/formylglycine-generating enzyme family protein [Pirellulales bacterium]|jgi:serine/threonine protein kinase/formylglycine-generating enzyme required for sulfatase activity|nr:bifunctional serine/threonine-protein kinase/formylglycine-generating enzyme family protein [Pirellulales bacterium]
MSAATISQACPSKDELARFCRGQLSTFRLEQIAEHLEGCRNCQSSLDDVSGAVDDLLAELRQLPSFEAPQDTALDGEMAGLESQPSAFFDTALEEQETVDATAPLPPRIGEYVLGETIGRGGMGTVYRAVHARLDKLVAIKVLSPHRLGDAAAVTRFEREMRAVGKLSHPNIVAATDAGEIDGAPFLVMEFINGIDLARLLRRHGPLGVADACEIARQAALGLECAHSHGLVHRDIKPSNLLLTLAPDQPTGGLVKVADLGLALLNEPEGGAGATSSATLVIGSLDYMAPEQADNAHQVDRRADLYSLGCALYELLTGRAPFTLPGQTRIQKLKAHADASVPPLAAACPKLPAGLEPLVRKLLAKDPADRIANAAELAAALQPFAKGANLAGLLDGQAPQIWAASARPSAAPPYRGRSIRTVLGCFGALVAAAVIYVQTDRGTLEIKSDDDEVKVRVERDGKLITLVDLKANKEIKLRSGTYDVALGDADQDLALDADEFTLRRGGKEVLHIRRQPPTLLRAPFDASEAKRHQERWASFRNVPDTVQTETGMMLTLVPPGEFEMRPGYRVKITKPYYLGTFEVTVGQFREFAEATGLTDLEREGRGVLDIGTFHETVGMNWRTEELAPSENHPVAGITWFDAERFCTWLSERDKKKYRLPTEAEWEWAARSGSMSAFGWGDEEERGGDFAWYEGNSDHHSHAIGGKQPNAWGLHDTNGNVVEWCQDWAVDPYPKGDVSDPAGPVLTAGTRTLRGGSFLNGAMRLISRGAFGPTQSMIHCGFRVCREL